MSTAEYMTCMEVWGGNQIVDSSVVLAGLDAWVYSRPHDGADAGGDVHYVSSCATGRITRLLVADVAGHGENVSQIAGQLRTMMRRYVNYMDQGRFVRAMNQQFGTLAEAGRFATAIVTTFFAPTRSLSICNAGHPPPILYDERTGQWMLLDARSMGDRADTNLPLGIADEHNYQQFEIDLNPRDMILCYTDSLIESRGADGEFLGTEGLLQLIRQLPADQPAQLIGQLLGAIESIHKDNLTTDDVTVLLYRPNQPYKVPWTRRLAAPFRLLATIPRSLLPGGSPIPWPEISLPNIGGAMIHSFNRLRRR
ncbi:MAG: serine/threonine-protein phosphatase [Phycisphaerales bacterium]|nr:serine/threonine-protein phosphatase [Phycisphaerales bacterium]